MKISDKQKFLMSTKLKQRHFADGMYRFAMFMIVYFSRVKTDLKMDYVSFMIVQVTVTNSMYQVQKNKIKKNYLEMEISLEKMIKKFGNEDEYLYEFEKNSKINVVKYNKLTISSICLMLGLPKETVRRKIQKLVERKILTNNITRGINLGEAYKKIYTNFVPTTVIQLARLIKHWNKANLLEALIDLKTEDK